MSFNTKTSVKDLYGEYVTAKPIDLPDRWSDEIEDFAYDVWEAAQCDKCGKWVVMHGNGESTHSDEDYHSDCDGYLISEGNMMNYAYPINVDRIGGEDEAALAIKHLPLCLIYMDDNFYLSLTGGGMDLTWEIVEAYMRLGYLPPVHFSNLPGMAGDNLNSTRKWIIAGMRRAVNINIGWLKSDLNRLSFLSSRLKER